MEHIRATYKLVSGTYCVSVKTLQDNGEWVQGRVMRLSKEDFEAFKSQEGVEFITSEEARND